MDINDQLEKICRESLNQFVKIDDGKLELTKKTIAKVVQTQREKQG